MIEGGWICRACWKSNRPEDDRCYRCKTPRDQQIDVAAGSLKEQSAPGYKMRGRKDTELPLLAALVGWPMSLSGWLGIIVGILIAVLAVLAGREANAMITIIAAAVFVLFGALFIFLGRSVRRHARWAYAVAAVAYLLPTAPTLLGLVEVPEDIVLPDWYLNTQTVIGIVYVLLGLCAVFLLVTSFIRQGDGEESASTEAG